MSNVLSLKLNNKDKTPFIINNVSFVNQNNTIIFTYKGVDYHINYQNETFERENQEFYFKLDFKQKSCIYILKEENITLDIKVEKCNFFQKKDSLFMNYMIESETNEINIEIDILKGELLK